MTVAIQAVEQGQCTECGKSNDNWADEERDFCSNGVDRRLLCECGAAAVVRIGEDGLDARWNITHKNASWNQEDDK